MNTATTAQTINARPTIHPAGTVLVNLFDPTETVTVIAGTDGIPSMSIPATSYKAFVSQTQFQARRLPPVVRATTPNHDSTGVSVASAVSVTFSQPMNTNSVQSALSTIPATTGSFTWGSGNTVLTYTPSSNLAGNTLYRLRIESTATDTNGLPPICYLLSPISLRKLAPPRCFVGSYNWPSRSQRLRHHDPEILRVTRQHQKLRISQRRPPFLPP